MLYRFYDEDQTINVSYISDSFNGHIRFSIVDIQGLDSTEVKAQFLFELGDTLWEDAFVSFATNKRYSLDKFENGVLLENLVTPLTLDVSVVGNGSTDPIEGEYGHFYGDIVDIEATPDANNKFDNFDINGDIVTENPYSLTIDSNKIVVANFSVSVFTLNISVSGNGSISPVAGIYNHPSGDIVNIEATPDAEHKFDNFDINGDIITENPHSLTIDSNKIVVANFSVIPEGGLFPYTFPILLS